MDNSEPRDTYNDTEDGGTAPRTIEEALELTLKQSLTRGVHELRLVFNDSFPAEALRSALTLNDLNVDKAVLYLQEMTDCTVDPAKSPEVQACPHAETEEFETIDSVTFSDSTYPIALDEAGTGIALDFSCSPHILRPESVKVFLIPDDVLRLIFSCLSGKESVHFGRVCRSWVAVERTYGDLYQRECVQMWPRNLSRPLNVAFPFPFNSPEALWGPEYPKPYLPTKDYIRSFKSWRNMFISRPRVYTTGVYISKTKYLRSGATEGMYVNPVHQVVFYRYFKFFPDHGLVCLTTSEKPGKVVPLLDFGYPGTRDGEWAVREKELVAHAVEKTNVFSYVFALMSSTQGMHDLLRLKECSVRSSSNAIPLKMDTSGNSFPRFFRFFRT